MILADGRTKPFQGKGTCKFEVEGKRVLQKVWIADIELDGVLGMDFVRRYGCQMQLFMPKLTNASGSRAQPAEETELSNYQCLRVVVEDRVLVSVHGEMIKASKVLDNCDGGLAILEPTLDFLQQNKLLVGRSLVKMDGPIPIRLLSPTSYL